LIDKREKAIQEFGAFVTGFVRDLNHRSEVGWALLVEGKRDERAMRDLGYSGTLATVSSYSKAGRRAFRGSPGVVVLTDLDREGGKMAARLMKKLSHDGFDASLAERRRLMAASKGVFLHVENLSRFADPEPYRPQKTESL
jgi:5S rRNA maturation endonuclease (ribonuclease M5)